MKIGKPIICAEKGYDEMSIVLTQEENRNLVSNEITEVYIEFFNTLFDVEDLTYVFADYLV